MIRKILAGAVVLIGCALLIYNLFTGNWLSGVMDLIAAALLAVAILSGYFSYICTDGYRMWGQALTLGSVLGIALFHPAFNNALKSAHEEAYSAALNGATSCGTNTFRFNDLRAKLIQSCITQDELTTLDAATQLLKAGHYGPGLTLADDSSAAFKDESLDICAKTYLEVKKMCPYGIRPLSEESEKALLQAMAGNG